MLGGRAAPVGNDDRRFLITRAEHDPERLAQTIGAGHVPGAINIGLSGQYASLAATVIGLGRPILIVAEDDEHVQESILRLARVGIETVIGYLEGGMLAWEKAGLAAQTLPQISVHELRETFAKWQVVDVRRPGEWAAGHIAGAAHHCLDHLSKSLETLDPQAPTAVHCKSGYRSSIAAGLLQARGFSEVSNVVGGLDAWIASGFPAVQ